MPKKKNDIFEMKMFPKSTKQYLSSSFPSVWWWCKDWPNENIELLLTSCKRPPDFLRHFPLHSPAHRGWAILANCIDHHFRFTRNISDFAQKKEFIVLPSPLGANILQLDPPCPYVVLENYSISKKYVHKPSAKSTKPKVNTKFGGQTLAL